MPGPPSHLEPVLALGQRRPPQGQLVPGPAGAPLTRTGPGPGPLATFSKNASSTERSEEVSSALSAGPPF